VFEVSFEVLPNENERFAVVGRTGAGKSTLSRAFFRILSFSGGPTTIDGVDISTIGLSDLRSKLTIIPQDPILFSGDLRSNLDHLKEHDDAKLWEAVKRVHLLESFQKDKLELDDENSKAKDIPLDYIVEEKGEGVKTIRSLLQTNKIIIMDEATASIDSDTGVKIQNTIRTELADRTVVCIAHRLRTIIDYDNDKDNTPGPLIGRPKERRAIREVDQSIAISTRSFLCLLFTR
jgi:ABC-type multidrug transport system fused ATPase/permease subunit